MYTNTYKQADMRALPQNQLEARTLIKAASMMNRIRDNWNELHKTELLPALEHNRKLWTILSSEMADGDHPMDHDLRQNIANLALFIFKHTIKISADKEPKARDLDILITINMEVARGLNEILPQNEQGIPSASSENVPQPTPEENPSATDGSAENGNTDADANTDADDEDAEGGSHLPSNIIT